MFKYEFLWIYIVKEIDYRAPSPIYHPFLPRGQKHPKSERYPFIHAFIPQWLPTTLYLKLPQDI